MKVVIILGTRPQIIKSAPLVGAFAKKGVECTIVNTGQHYDYEMNRAFFSELRLPEPELDLGVGAGTPNAQISKIIAGLDSAIGSLRPDLVVVPGDTNSALAAGIACSKLGIPIAHLEAGCRSNDPSMSEEVNRRVLDHLSNVLLCPTRGCVRNLRREHAPAGVVENVGDTMYDSMKQCMGSVRRSDAVRRFNLKKDEYAFMTLHRAESVDHKDSLDSILSAVSSFDTTVLFSVHPRTKARIAQFGIKIPRNMELVDPLPYFDSLKLVKDSRIVITDSGGLQKEAFWLHRPSLITRKTTEWDEIVRTGAALLVGTETKSIIRGYAKLMNLRPDAFEGFSPIFGKGDAAERAVSVVRRYVAALEVQRR